MNPKILISTSTFASQDDAPLQRLQEAGFSVQLNPFKRKLTKDELLTLIPGHVGLIAGLETLDHEVLSRSTLKVISRCGAGMSNVDLEAAKRLNIVVFNTPDAPTTAVAELTVGCLLNLLRQVGPMNRDLHDGQWNKRTGEQLEGKTVCVIGYGRIGKRVAHLLEIFGVRLLVVDPVSRERQTTALDKALPEADIVLLHCSGEEKILSEKEFRLMKKGSYLLNAARGGLIDEKALVSALKNGTVAGAWLDTFDQEPYQGELTSFDQVLLTPHIGSYTKECRLAMEMEAVNNLIKGMEQR